MPLELLSKKDLNKVKNICELIRENKNFLITTHQNIDGDAIGSELAIYLILKKLNKKGKIINWDKVPSLYQFLPYVEEAEVFDRKRFKNNFDVVIVVDCGSLERVVDISDHLKKTPIINIDHHITNSKFGNINWVNSEFSATGEMVYFLTENFNTTDKEIAICLYTAILTDTGRFTYRFSKYTIHIVKNLIETGIPPDKISQKIYLEKPLKSIKLLSLVLRNLEYDEKNKVCWAKVTKQMYKKTNTDETDTEGFSDFLSEIKEPEVTFLLKEKENGVKVSLRSKNNFDVEKLARKFGGGGHKSASGCFFKNKTIKEVEKIILQEIEINGWNYKCK